MGDGVLPPVDEGGRGLRLTNHPQLAPSSGMREATSSITFQSSRWCTWTKGLIFTFASKHSTYSRTVKRTPVENPWKGLAGRYLGVSLGSRHEVEEISTLLGYYAPYSGNSVPIFRDRQVVLKRRCGINTIRCVISHKSSEPRVYLDIRKILCTWRPSLSISYSTALLLCFWG